MNGHLFLVSVAGKEKQKFLLYSEGKRLQWGMQPSPSSSPVEFSVGVKTPPQSLSRCPP